MSLITQARADVLAITTNLNEFGLSLIFENTASPVDTATVTGIFSKHHIDVNRQGVAFNSRMAHVSVSELEFDAANYDVRNANGEVDLKDHKVTMEGKQYIVNQWFPSDTTKLITIILGDYAD
jgi:hypothetical protein